MGAVIISLICFFFSFRLHRWQVSVTTLIAACYSSGMHTAAIDAKKMRTTRECDASDLANPCHLCCWQAYESGRQQMSHRAFIHEIAWISSSRESVFIAHRRWLNNERCASITLPSAYNLRPLITCVRIQHPLHSTVYTPSLPRVCRVRVPIARMLKSQHMHDSLGPTLTDWLKKREECILYLRYIYLCNYYISFGYALRAFVIRHIRYTYERLCVYDFHCSKNTKAHPHLCINERIWFWQTHARIIRSSVRVCVCKWNIACGAPSYQLGMCFDVSES